MEAQEGHSVEAEQLMRRSTELSPKDPQIWLTWGNIKRREDKVKDALSKYEEAYRLSPNDSVVLNSLGQAKARLGEYEDADKLFRLALVQETDGSSRKHKIINLSSIADNLMRWYDHYEKSRDHITAEKKLREAVDICIEVINLDDTDIKSQDLYRLALMKLGFFYKRHGNLEKSAKYFERAIVKKTVKSMRYKEAKDTLLAITQAAKLYIKIGQVECAKSIVTPEISRLRNILRSTDVSEEFNDVWNELYETVAGSIIRVDLENNRFVIIEANSSPGHTYIGYVKNFSNQKLQVTMQLVGKKVSFTPTEIVTSKGRRIEAKSIKIIE